MSAEVLLLLAIQRGKLSWILQWIHQSLTVGKTNPDLKISTEPLRLSFHHIKSSSGGGKFSEDLSVVFETSKICLEKAARSGFHFHPFFCDFLNKNFENF